MTKHRSITLRISEEELDQVKKLASKKNMSVSEYIRYMSTFESRAERVLSEVSQFKLDFVNKEVNEEAQKFLEFLGKAQAQLSPVVSFAKVVEDTKSRIESEYEGLLLSSGERLKAKSEKLLKKSKKGAST